MKKRNYFHIGIMVFKRMTLPYYQGAPAELAFFFLMSMVPIAIILGELLGIFSLSRELLIDILGDYVSVEITETIAGFLIYTPSGAINAFFIFFALWAASKAQFSMMRITNYSFTGDPSGNGYFRERFRAIKTILITIFTLVFSLIILIYGEVILTILSSYVTGILGLTFKFDYIWLFFRWPIAMALYFLMVSYNYYVLPSERLKFKAILPGSILASVGMLLATWLYSFYISRFANYDVLYGSLGAIIALPAI